MPYSLHAMSILCPWPLTSLWQCLSWTSCVLDLFSHPENVCRDHPMSLTTKLTLEILVRTIICFWPLFSSWILLSRQSYIPVLYGHSESAFHSHPMSLTSKHTPEGLVVMTIPCPWPLSHARRACHAHLVSSIFALEVFVMTIRRTCITFHLFMIWLFPLYCEFTSRRL